MAIPGINFLLVASAAPLDLQDTKHLEATSVPVEHIFSGGTNLVTHKRGSLAADTICACMYLKNWHSKVTL